MRDDNKKERDVKDEAGRGIPNCQMCGARGYKYSQSDGLWCCYSCWCGKPRARVSAEPVAAEKGRITMESSHEPDAVSARTDAREATQAARGESPTMPTDRREPGHVDDSTMAPVAAEKGECFDVLPMSDADKEFLRAREQARAEYKPPTFAVPVDLLTPPHVAPPASTQEAACLRCGSTEPKIRGAEDLGEKGRPSFYPCNNDRFHATPPPVAHEACPKCGGDGPWRGKVDVQVVGGVEYAKVCDAPCHATPASPPPDAPTVGEVERVAKVLADANCDYCEPKTGFEGKRFGVDLPEHFCDMYRHMARAALAAIARGSK